VRETADPATGGVTGQRVAVYVDVLFKDAMGHPPRVEIPEVRGTQIFRFETQGSTIRETIDEASYVGQRFEFAFYARRDGKFALPPADVTLLDREGAATGEAKGAPVTIAIAAPPGVGASQPIVATQRLTLEQSWSPDAKKPHHLGDAVVRTGTRIAEDVPALAFADPRLDAPQGVRAYASPPDVLDSVNRGALTGKRIDRITYVFEQPGSYKLPDFRQVWWDLSQNKARSVEASGLAFDVEAAQAEPRSSNTGKIGWAWAAAGLVLVLLIYASSRVLRRSPNPEAEAHVVFAKACGTTDAAATYRAFAAWRDQLPLRMRERANEAATSLLKAVFGGDGNWSHEAAEQLLKQTNRLHVENRPLPAQADLPPLNPGAPHSAQGR
jgi:hypothetical protein